MELPSDTLRCLREAGRIAAEARTHGARLIVPGASLREVCEEVERRMAAANTIRRLVDAREIAYVVAFLASPKSIAINGDAIAAGGGAPRAIHY